MSLYEELVNYGRSDFYPYHMPGHKRIAALYLPEGFAQTDITEIEGFDDLHDPKGIIRDAERYCAKVMGADSSYFLVGGSTAGVLAGISAATSKGGKLLMVRNSHRSVYNAVGLRDLKTGYIYTAVNERYGFNEAATLDEVAEALEENPDAEAVFIVSPTYEGRLADVRKIAEAVHKRKIPLIVDEAHGAHLPFAKSSFGFGESAITAGADIVIQSVHKTLPAPTQTALLHVNGDIINRERLRRFLGVYQSSSPSYPLMAGIDGSVRYMAEQGKELLYELSIRFSELTGFIDKNLRFIDCISPVEGGHDPGKLIISADRGGMNGKELVCAFRERYHLETEMCCERYVLAMFTVADTDEAYDRMKNALAGIDEMLADRMVIGTGGEGTDSIPARSSDQPGDNKQTDKTDKYAATQDLSVRPEQVMSVSESWESMSEELGLSDSVGKVSASFIYLYPPGTPIIVPGERISAKTLELIERYRAEGLNVVGVRDGLLRVHMQSII